MSENTAGSEHLKMSLRTTATANYLAAGIAAAAPLLALPYYLTHLGAEGWGLVSFALTLVVIIGMLEIGISQRLVRDLSLLAHRGRSGFLRVFRPIESYYWMAAAALALVVLLLAPLVVQHWLHLSSEHERDGYLTVYFCAALLLTQIPNAAYRSLLVANDRQVALCIQQTAINLIKHGGGILVVTRGGGLEGLYIHWAVTAVVDVATRKWITRRGPSDRAEVVVFDWQQARVLLTSGLRMSVAVVTSIFALQLDRLYMSKLGSLSDLGIYSIAVALAYGALQLSAPLIAAVAPRMAVASTTQRDLDQLCKKLLTGMLLSVFAAAALYLAVGEYLVLRWLKSAETFDQLRWTLRLLLIGTALNTLYQIGYQRWIALGQTRIILHVNVLALLVAATLTPVMILRFGMVGATAAWIGLNVVGLAFHARWLVHLAFSPSVGNQPGQQAQDP